MKLDPFQKSTPSLFFLSSPFQVLCAKEAIEAFYIKEYKIYILVSEESKLRNIQMFNLLNRLQLHYQVFYYYGDYIKNERLKVFIPHFTKYKRAFVGDVRDMRLIFTAFKNISNKGNIIYLDDGAVNIALFKNSYTHKKNIKDIVLKLASIFRGIHYGTHFFTLYADINNKKFNLKQNNLKSLYRNNFKGNSNIYIIGTNPTDYIKGWDITLSQFEQSFERLILDLRKSYPEDNIVYIAHGRDNTHNIPSLCANHNIVYIRPTEIVETYLLNINVNPKLIIGFTSSALYNLKKIYPNSIILNYLYYSKSNIEYSAISQYYQKHGIITKLFK